MSRLNAANRAKSALTANINNETTVLSVEDISLFPDPPFVITIDDEIIEVGGKDALNDQLTDLVRGQEGTTPDSHSLGASVEHRFTAGTYDGLRFVPKGARFVIGTSTAGWTKYDCDYLCDGVADDVEINAAIQALPVGGGGKILILDGTYNIADTIVIEKGRVTICGNGSNTILKRAFNGGSLLGIYETTFVRISNIRLVGESATYSSSNNSGIRIFASADISINGVEIFDFAGSAVEIEFSAHVNVKNNFMQDSNCGVDIKSGASTCNIIGNTIVRGFGYPSDYSATQFTIILRGYGNAFHFITNNNCMGKAPTVEGGAGNTIFNNKYDNSTDPYIFEDKGEDEEWEGVKYRLVMIDGEAFMEVIEA